MQGAMFSALEPPVQSLMHDITNHVSSGHSRGEEQAPNHISGTTASYGTVRPQNVAWALPSSKGSTLSIRYGLPFILFCVFHGWRCGLVVTKPQQRAHSSDIQSHPRMLGLGLSFDSFVKDAGSRGVPPQIYCSCLAAMTRSHRGLFKKTG